MNAPSAPLTLYGIPNCDTVKRARAWLDARGVEHRFHDFKKAGVPESALQRWLATAGWERLLNRRGTTWRALPESVQAGATDEAGAALVMRGTPSVIKRPVVEWPGGEATVGFDEADWSARVAAAESA
jgi:arsenate reductase (glutaredoxin)